MSKGKPTLFFSETTTTRGEYTHTRITVRTGEERALSKLIADCEDNKAGYSSRGSADEQCARYTWLRDQGYLGVWRSRFDGVYIQLEWQHYTRTEDGPQYCEMTISEFPRHLDEARNAMKLIDRLFAAGDKLGHSAYVMKDDPKYMRDVLARLNAKPLVRVDIPREVTGNSWSTEDCTTRSLATVSALKAA